MVNEEYQSLFGASEEVVRAKCSTVRRGRGRQSSSAARRHTGPVAVLVRDLGGHDLADVLDALRRARASPDGRR